ncbi:MAG: L-2-amino-thiazoline-4-carboxylic acid hydrolase [Vicinamibacteria bacterium]|nr:L-2-amino-thiazoline-4-carboxylic acid hydrolase [Vicinamibacteria bacterium]
MHDWLHRLACPTDFCSMPAFSSKIDFKRTKTLIQGHGCCDHRLTARRSQPQAPGAVPLG